MFKRFDNSIQIFYILNKYRKNSDTIKKSKNNIKKPEGLIPPGLHSVYNDCYS